MKTIKNKLEKNTLKIIKLFLSFLSFAGFFVFNNLFNNFLDFFFLRWFLRCVFFNQSQFAFSAVTSVPMIGHENTTLADFLRAEFQNKSLLVF